MSTSKTHSRCGASEAKPFLSDPQHDATVKKHLLLEAVDARSSPAMRASSIEVFQGHVRLQPSGQEAVLRRLHDAGGVGPGAALIACVHLEEGRPARSRDGL